MMKFVRCIAFVKKISLLEIIDVPLTPNLVFQYCFAFVASRNFVFFVSIFCESVASVVHDEAVVVHVCRLGNGPPAKKMLSSSRRDGAKVKASNLVAVIGAGPNPAVEVDSILTVEKEATRTGQLVESPGMMVPMKGSGAARHRVFFAEVKGVKEGEQF